MPKVLRINQTLVLPGSRKSVLVAARLIRRGGLVAFPTETVYGLGAAATDRSAVKKIFKAKGRPADNPLIVHVAGLDQVKESAASLPPGALHLMKRFWPGPLSLVLPRSDKIPPEVSAGLPTVAVRMPAHPVALSLIRAAGVPIAAPSANRSGRPSPTSLRHVLEDLAGKIDAVIDGGPCQVGLESTVLDLSGSHPLILRPGAITREQLEAVLGVPVAVAQGCKDGTPPSPGMKYRHYAPRAPLLLVAGARPRRRALLAALARHYRKKGLKVGLLRAPTEPEGLRRAAKRLYQVLRGFDAQGVDLILAEGVSARGLGAALMNRLRRAAARTIKV
ncbi:MAG: threonylcarbamoyl-AMP synthase [Firmicutes bacterium]|jgi:L-threonylcarbamoyladenylate synthase|nr:threonylcarbamoyl-AMP synthase [Bacillota bacterium]HPU00429.1 L-threonylcarbamoyladenylate synthase [Bacillota bacterium]